MVIKQLVIYTILGIGIFCFLTSCTTAKTSTLNSQYTKCNSIKGKQKKLAYYQIQFR